MLNFCTHIYIYPWCAPADAMCGQCYDMLGLGKTGEYIYSISAATVNLSYIWVLPTFDTVNIANPSTLFSYRFTLTYTPSSILIYVLAPLSTSLPPCLPSCTLICLFESLSTMLTPIYLFAHLSTFLHPYLPSCTTTGIYLLPY